MILHKHIFITGFIDRNPSNDHEENEIIKNLFKENNYIIEGPFLLDKDQEVPCDYSCKTYYIAKFS